MVGSHLVIQELVGSDINTKGWYISDCHAAKAMEHALESMLLDKESDHLGGTFEMDTSCTFGKKEIFFILQ